MEEGDVNRHGGFRGSGRGGAVPPCSMAHAPLHGGKFPPSDFLPPWRFSATANCFPRQISAAADYSRGGFPPQEEIKPPAPPRGGDFPYRHATKKFEKLTSLMVHQ